MKNFRTYQLAKKLYKECNRLKFKNRAIQDQFDRASLSIPLNISEGNGRRTKKDRARFYSIALGSLRETQSLLDLTDNTQLFALTDSLGAHLYRLIQHPGGI